MANLAIAKIILDGHKWPGAVNRWNWYPTKTAFCGTTGKGWDNTVDNFSSADETQRALNAGQPTNGGTRTPLGTKISCYYDSTENPGYYTVQYLAFHSFEDGMDISKDFSDGKFWCSGAAIGCISCSEWADTSTGPWFVVTRCSTGGDQTQGSPVCIPCSTHIYSDGTGVATNGYGDGCGWFLIDGVMPCKDITLLDDETGAGKGVEITCQCERGDIIIEITGDQPILMPADVSNLTDATGLVGIAASALTIGWACASAA